MEPRQEKPVGELRNQQTEKRQQAKPKKQFRIVKLEERIAPQAGGLHGGHHYTRWCW